MANRKPNRYNITVIRRDGSLLFLHVR